MSEPADTAAAKSGGIAPFSALEWSLAWRYLRSRRRDRVVSLTASFSVLGIALGVAILIAISAIFEGALGDIMDKVLGLDGHVLITPIAEQRVEIDGLVMIGRRLYIADVDTKLETIRAQPGVVQAFPLIQKQMIASANGNNIGIEARGIRPSDLRNIDAIMRAGTDRDQTPLLTGFEAGEGVAIGQGVAAKLGTYIGDTLVLINPTGRSTPLGTKPVTVSYRVAAVIDLGFGAYNNSIIFLPMADARALMGAGGGASHINVVTENPRQMGDLPATLARELTDENVFGWQDLNLQIVQIFAVQKRAVALAIILVVMIAALNIISGLTMLVKDHSHDIAILRTIGATSGGILRVFLIAGTLIGVVGIALGVFLGLAICWNIETIDGWLAAVGMAPGGTGAFLFDRLSADVLLDDVLLAVGVSFGLSVLATLYPAWRAARIDPVEALRYE